MRRKQNQFIEPSIDKRKLARYQISLRGPISSSSFVVVLKCKLKGFGQVYGSPSGSLENLLPAAKTIGDNQRIGRRVANRRQQHPLANRL